jgi:uncharacterized protein (TIGR01244 family)
MKRRIACLLVFVLGAISALSLYHFVPGLMRTQASEPPANLVVIDEHLATSGQPSPEQLDALADSGYELVINLAPPTSMGSVPDEGYRLASGGITYVNIPVDFRAPRPRDFQQFGELLKGNRDRSVLVHCQINKRASVFTFLYRVTQLGVDPDEAIEQVYAIWVPDQGWSDFIDAVLAEAGIDFVL